jgi:hypothetical protein
MQLGRHHVETNENEEGAHHSLRGREEQRLQLNVKA